MSEKKLTNNNSGNTSFLNLFNFLGLFAYTQKIRQTQTGGDQLSFLLKIQIVQTVAPRGSHNSDVFHFGGIIVLGSVVHSARFFGTRNHENTTESNRHPEEEKTGKKGRSGTRGSKQHRLVSIVVPRFFVWWEKPENTCVSGAHGTKKRFPRYGTAPEIERENSRKAFCQV